MEPDIPLSPAVRRLVTVLLGAGMAALWLLDLVSVDAGGGTPLPVLTLVFGTLTALALLSPGRRPGPAIRAGIAALGSLALTTLYVTGTRAEFSWGLLETTALLGLLVRTARRMRRPAAAVALSAALGVAVIALPLRMSTDYETVTFSFILTFAVGGAAGLGCYLRLLDARRARAMTAVRQNERLELARDLHDFVAHHVTGIIVHANAALMIQESSPEQVKPLLEGISRAGSETLDSMRRLVRVLREDDHQAARPGELLTELDRLVSAFAGHGTEARLDAEPAVHGIRLAPEVETSVHRVVQEALTNVRRHAPGADVAVRLGLDRRAGADLLLVEVRNTAPTARSTVPTGGRSGFGLVGLRERVEAVEGSLTSGRTPDGGWSVRAGFPVLAAVEGSPV
ncbi:MAG: two-component sensor histidine kinase [Streptomyces sp.]|nr:two-component sensor histidine kinase [Streptomyces sp.]NUT24487.1 two-component sensor histidine kinase [Streptomyces sp.]